MKKLFISQPMRDKSRNLILAERIDIVKKAEDILGKGTFTVINSLFDDDTVAENKPLYNLGRSLQLLSEADVAIFSPDFAGSSGCWIEYECAKSYGIDTIQIQKKE